MNIWQLTYQLKSPPPRVEIPGVQVRTFGRTGDERRWLDVQRAAFAALEAGVAHWDEVRFRREFTAHPHWQSEWLYLAESMDAAETNPPQALGSISLRLHDLPSQAPRATIGWLAVVPEAQRRGIGRLLLSVAHAYCWQRGYRQIEAQTHRRWHAAVEFYLASGYRLRETTG